MQLNISQSQHSLVTLLHHNNLKMAKRIVSNYKNFRKFANFSEF